MTTTMEGTAFRGVPSIYSYSPQKMKGASFMKPASMAAQKPAKTISAGKNSTVVPVGGPPRSSSQASSSPVKLLTRVESLKLLTKAEKAGLLSTAEKFGLSLSSIEKLGLLSKAEELGVLSAATDPGTPSGLFAISFGLLLLGPSFVYLVPADYTWEVALQAAVALVSVVGGSAAFAAANFVSVSTKNLGGDFRPTMSSVFITFKRSRRIIRNVQLKAC